MPVKNLFCVRAAALIAALTVCGALYADQPFSSLEERMTAREFREAGLDKLSPEELAALNRWIRERSLAEGEAVELRRQQAGPAGDRRGFDDGDRSTIRSRIKGPFTGWTGKPSSTSKTAWSGDRPRAAYTTCRRCRTRRLKSGPACLAPGS